MEIRPTLGAALGRWQFLRGKSAFYIEAIRAWVTPAAAAGAFAKYLGISGYWSIVVAVVMPLLVEAAGFLLGRFLYDHGGVAAEYKMARDRDVYKVEQLDLQRRTLAVEEQMAATLERLRAAAERVL